MDPEYRSTNSTTDMDIDPSSTNHDIPIFFFMMSQKWFTVKFDGKNPWISSTMTLATHGCNTKVSENLASPKRLLSHKGVSERGVFPPNSH